MIQLKRSTPLTTHQRTFRRHLLILAAVTFIVNLTGLIAEFTFDDNFIIVDNPRVHNLSDWKQIWWSGYWPQSSSYKHYRPLTVFTYAVNWALHGQQPEGYHLFNAAIYLAIVLLIYTMLRRWHFVPMVALWTALLFAVHPIHVEAVVGIVGRAELLCTFFILLALHFDDNIFTAGDEFAWRWLPASMICYAFALLSKEHAVCFLGILLFIDVFRYKQRAAPAASDAGQSASKEAAKTVQRKAGANHYVLRHLTVRYGSVLVVFACFMVARHLVFDGHPGTPAYVISKIDNPAARDPEFRESFPLRTVLALRVLGKYAQLAVFPRDLCPDYGYIGFALTGAPVERTNRTKALTTSPRSTLQISKKADLGGFGRAGIAILVALIVVGVASVWRGSGLAAVAVGGFFASYFLVSNSIILIPVVLAERVFFLPSLFICMLAGIAIQLLLPSLERIGHVRTLNYLLLGAVLLLSVRTVFRNFDMMNNLTLFRSAHTLYPDGVRICNNYAASLDTAGFLDQAEQLYRHSLSVYANFAPAYFGLGGIYSRREQIPNAIECLTLCIKLDSYHHAARYRLGRISYLTGDLDKAVVHARRAIAIRPDVPQYHDLLAIILKESGEEYASREQVAQRIKRFPQEPVPHYLQGIFHEDDGELLKAQEEYKAAVQLNPDFAEGYLQLARVSLQLADNNVAGDAFEAYFRLRPKDWQSRLEFVQLLTLSRDDKIHDLDRALEQLEAAEAVASGHLLILSAKVEVLIERGDKQQALAELDRILDRLTPEAFTRFLFEQRRELLLQESSDMERK